MCQRRAKTAVGRRPLIGSCTMPTNGYGRHSRSLAYTPDASPVRNPSVEIHGTCSRIMGIAQRRVASFNSKKRKITLKPFKKRLEKETKPKRDRKQSEFNTQSIQPRPKKLKLNCWSRFGRFPSSAETTIAVGVVAAVAAV